MHVCVKMMLKGLKEALTVLIVTYVTHVKGVKRSLNSFTVWLQRSKSRLFKTFFGLKIG